MKQKLTLLLLALVTTMGAWATDVTVIDHTKNATTYGSLSNGTFTTNSDSGMEGVTISGISSTTATSFSYGACLGFTSVRNGTVTMTAPTGYIITGYTLTARSNTFSAPYTLTPYVGGSAVTTSTEGVNLTASGLAAQTASFTYSAGSVNSFYIPSMIITVISEETVNLINVTYELYESDGTTLVSSDVIQQVENSAIQIPSSFTAATYYDYTTEGTIGSSDCTIKVTRTLKSGYVISLDGLSNSKCYNIRNNRGTWAVGPGTTVVNSTAELNLAFMASDAKQQFAFITYEGNVYLYSVREQKFAYVDGTKLSLTADVTSAVAASPVTFQTSTAPHKASEPIIVTVGGKMYGVSTGKSPDVFQYDNHPEDDGNCAIIIEAGPFDATSALAALEEYFHPSYTVTYIVKDGSDNVLFTSEPVATTNGANITTLPAEYQLTNFYEYNTVDVTISASGNTNVEFTATPKENPLVRYTADTSNPYYYNLNIRSKYLVYNTEAIGQVTLQDTSEPFNANASWAFIGEPYAGFKVINKSKGTDYFLTYTSVVPGKNGGNNGSNNNVQFVASGDFNNRYWIVDKNSGGFCLRMKENTNIYFHHQSIENSNGYLRTCSTTEWGSVHNDAGSTLVASTDEDVLIALYNSMKDYTYGTAIGQYSAEDVTAEEAKATILGVGSAITNNMTSAYADAYAALNTLQTKTSLNTPSAGFYRLKNVATNEYLTAISGPYGYTSTTRGVYANGDANSAATVIRLYDKNGDGKLYMYNQGNGFGWTDANKVDGSGAVGYLSSNPDKYVNWFPGTASGQIGFAICYGNGTGGYASYLETGIYTVDTDDESVIAGTNSRADAAQWIVEEATSVTVAMHSDGAGTPTYYATFCAPFSYTVNGAKAYTLAKSDNVLTPTEVVGAVPAGTPVLLEGTSSTATLTISGTDYAATPLTSDLTGTYLPIANFDGTTNYTLGSDGAKVGFYHWNGTTLSANRAYVAGSSSSGNVKGYVLNFDDDATGIEMVNGQSSMVNDPIYNLAGQRISKMQKGINIVNGKKVLK